jgi:serine/threonine protein kinase
MKMQSSTDDYNSLQGSGRSDKYMSTKESSEFNTRYSTKEINIDDFVIKAVIGRGSFGKVYCVTKKDNNKVYAMKTLKKEMILKRD